MDFVIVPLLYAGLKWVANRVSEFGGDGGRLAVAGDSNGGTLAAAISLMARDHDGPPISAQAQSSTAAGNGCSGANRYPTDTTTQGTMLASARQIASDVSKEPTTKPPPKKYTSTGRGP
jgi:acetyl esterase/lipase